jgi:hypothetical protein
VEINPKNNHSGLASNILSQVRSGEMQRTPLSCVAAYVNAYRDVAGEAKLQQSSSLIK